MPSTKKKEKGWVEGQGLPIFLKIFVFHKTITIVIGKALMWGFHLLVIAGVSQ